MAHKAERYAKQATAYAKTEHHRLVHDSAHSLKDSHAIDKAKALEEKAASEAFQLAASSYSALDKISILKSHIKAGLATHPHVAEVKIEQGIDKLAAKLYQAEEKAKTADKHAVKKVHADEKKRLEKMFNKIEKSGTSALAPTAAILVSLAAFALQW
jgi:hypothetical protein